MMRLGWLASAALLLNTTPAAAEDSSWIFPMELGASVRVKPGRPHSTSLALGFRPEWSWRSESAFGAGAYGELWTNAFTDVVVGAGFSGLTPWGMTLSAGPYVRRGWASGHVGAGIAASLFLGIRTVESSSPSSWSPSTTVGIRVDGRWGLGNSGQRNLFICLELDLLLPLWVVAASSMVW